MTTSNLLKPKENSDSLQYAHVWKRPLCKHPLCPSVAAVSSLWQVIIVRSFFHYTIIASTQNILAAVYGRARQLNIRAPVCWDLVSKLPRWIALLSVSAVLNRTKIFLGLHKINIPKELFSSRNTILLACHWHFLHISTKVFLDSGYCIWSIYRLLLI